MCVCDCVRASFSYCGLVVCVCIPQLFSLCYDRLFYACIVLPVYSIYVIYITARMSNRVYEN